MHRAETDRNVTPTTYQSTGNIESERAEAQAHGVQAASRRGPVSTGASRADIEAAESPTERVVPAGTDSVVIGQNAWGIGGRWDTFQSHLRERRKQAVAQCKTCAGESAGRHEGTGDLRKAV